MSNPRCRICLHAIKKYTEQPCNRCIFNPNVIGYTTYSFEEVPRVNSERRLWRCIYKDTHTYVIALNIDEVKELLNIKDDRFAIIEPMTFEESRVL